MINFVFSILQIWIYTYHFFNISNSFVFYQSLQSELNHTLIYSFVHGTLHLSPNPFSGKTLLTQGLFSSQSSIFSTHAFLKDIYVIIRTYSCPNVINCSKSNEIERFFNQLLQVKYHIKFFIRGEILFVVNSKKKRHHLRKQNSNIGAYKRGAAAEGRCLPFLGAAARGRRPILEFCFLR